MERRGSEQGLELAAGEAGHPNPGISWNSWTGVDRRRAVFARSAGHRIQSS